VPSPTDEFLRVLLPGLAESIFLGAASWIAYLALEPFVRRHSPGTMISWTRLLAGRARDPILGRDLLAGAGAGVAIGLLILLPSLAPRWFGIAPPMPFLGLDGLEALRGLRPAVGDLFDGLMIAVVAGLTMLFVLVLLRMALRRAGPAVAAFFAVMALLSVLQGWRGNPGIDVPGGLLIAGLTTWILVRFGLLAIVIANWIVLGIVHYPVVFDLRVWYAPVTGLALLLIGVCLIYGVVTARVRPLPAGAAAGSG
jgi:serine/threonine-protein kinase